jgi:hypothetical protein
VEIMLNPLPVKKQSRTYLFKNGAVNQNLIGKFILTNAALSFDRINCNGTTCLIKTEKKLVLTKEEYIVVEYYNSRGDRTLQGRLLGGDDNTWYNLPNGACVISQSGNGINEIFISFYRYQGDVNGYIKNIYIEKLGGNS